MSSLTTYIKRAPVYGAATALVAASAVMNARYGAGLGETDIDKAVWITASVGSDILKAASPLALVWAVRNKSILTGLAALVLISITVLYSALAAIGFSATARDSMNAKTDQQNERYERAQEAYKTANTELQAVGMVRPIKALEARISTILTDPYANTEKGPCGMIDGDYTRKWCPVVAVMKVELAKSKRKARLEAQRDKARDIMDAAPALETPDPQAATIAAYIKAVTSVNVDAKAIQPWLAGIAALLVELGSAFGFLIANAGIPTHRQQDNNDHDDDQHKRPSIKHQPARNTNVLELLGIELPANNKRNSVETMLQIAHDTGKPPIPGIERRSCGTLRVSQRLLAENLGRGRRAIARELQELAHRGLIALKPTRAGTMITFTA
jgi:hypothetical protein